MHELGYCEAVVDAVERRAGGRPVARVGVRIGSTHRVVPAAFQQSFELVAAGGVADGARTEVVVVPATAHCRECGEDFSAPDPSPACPRCGGLDVDVEGGDEVTLEWLEYRADADVDTRVGELAVCLAIPGEIVELLPGNNEQLALVDVVGVKRRINIGLLEAEPVQPGDWVLIHVGFAMSKVDEREAAEALSMLEMMGQAFTDELQAVAESSIE